MCCLLACLTGGGSAGRGGQVCRPCLIARLLTAHGRLLWLLIDNVCLPLPSSSQRERSQTVNITYRVRTGCLFSFPFFLFPPPSEPRLGHVTAHSVAVARVLGSDDSCHGCQTLARSTQALIHILQFTIFYFLFSLGTYLVDRNKVSYILKILLVGHSVCWGEKICVLLRGPPTTRRHALEIILVSACLLVPLSCIESHHS